MVFIKLTLKNQIKLIFKKNIIILNLVNNFSINKIF